MKILFIALCLAGSAGAQQPAQPAPAAPAAQHAAAPGGKYYADIMLTVKNLAVLVDKGGSIPPERLDALAPELRAFNARLRGAIGEDLLAEIAKQEKEAEDKALSAEAEKTLQSLRAVLQVAYTEAGGKYPASPAELAPRLINAMPQLRLPGHAATDKVTVVDSKKFDKDVSKAVTDSGGWLYFSNPGSANYGLLLLDCSHAGPDGDKYYVY